MRMEDDDMATPTMRFKPEMWTTLVDAALFEQAATSAAVVATIPTGTSVATLGESADNAWRLCVAGDPDACCSSSAGSSRRSFPAAIRR